MGGASTIPSPRAFLGGVLLTRVGLVAALLGRTMGGAVPSPVEPWLIAVVVGAAGLVTAWLLVDLRAGRMPGPTALVLQAATDILVVTALIGHLAGAATPLAALYVLLVAVYALLLPVPRGILIVGWAVACYVAVTVTSGEAEPEAGFWAQVGVIAFVGVLTTILGNRLAGVIKEQHSLRMALNRARLEAWEILDTIQSGVITVDGDGLLRYANPRALAILGNEGFSVGRPVMDVIGARSAELRSAVEQGLRRGTRVGRSEASVRRIDGSAFPVGLSTTTFTGSGQEQPSVTAVFTDISDLKRLQEYRVHTERLEAVAALSASLAHEIRNPLAAIRSSVEQLAAAAADDEDQQMLASLVMRESERLNRLLGEFLDFSRVRTATLERLDLLELLHASAGVVRMYPEAAGVSIVISGEPTAIDADHDLMHRVATNLMLNAAQAMAGSGTISVSVETVPADRIPAGAIERPIRVVIADDGPGIPESIRGRLYEPFVTGRPGGTGLGLAIVQRAVAAHRGVILVDSAPGSGTRFDIYLPSTWIREDPPA